MKIRKGLVESEGHRIAYLAVNKHLISGEGPAIVFVHGVLASVNHWRECVPHAFRNDRAWYSQSLPAHHPSTVPTDFAPEHVNEQWFYDVMYGAFRELLRDRKSIIVGHSTGGFHSGNWGGVEGLLVKLAGLGSWTEDLFAFNIRLASKCSFIQRVFTSLLAYNRRAYRANPISRRLFETIRPDVHAQNPAALFPLFNGIGCLEIAEQLCHINVPCYLFAGTHNPVLPARQSLLLAGNIERVKTIVSLHVGYMPFMEDAEAYTAALERALDDIEAPDQAIRLRSSEPHKKGALHHELN